MTNRISGFLLINKEKDISSHSAINPIKRIYNTKVGHTGTLDPMATGMIVCAVGQARKFIQFAQQKARKYYAASIQLGIATDTGDITGNQIAQSEIKNLSSDKIETVIQTEFTGTIKQKPPAFSALKYKGKPYYTYARKGKEIPIPERLVNIDNINSITYDPERQQIHLETLVSSGTYIRTLAEDIGKSLNTLGCLSALERVYVEPWKNRKYHQLEEIKRCSDPHSLLIPIEESLDHIKKIHLCEQTIQKLKHGIRVSDIENRENTEMMQAYNEKDVFQGIVKVENNKIIALKMLQQE